MRYFLFITPSVFTVNMCRSHCTWAWDKWNGCFFPATTIGSCADLWGMTTIFIWCTRHKLLPKTHQSLFELSLVLFYLLSKVSLSSVARTVQIWNLILLSRKKTTAPYLKMILEHIQAEEPPPAIPATCSHLIFSRCTIIEEEEDDGPLPEDDFGAYSGGRATTSHPSHL